MTMRKHALTWYFSIPLHLIFSCTSIRFIRIYLVEVDPLKTVTPAPLPLFFKFTVYFEIWRLRIVNDYVPLLVYNTVYNTVLGDNHVTAASATVLCTKPEQDEKNLKLC